MSPLRPFAIALIFVIATLAWIALGSSVMARSGTFDDRLSREVALLWGGPQAQVAPGVHWDSSSVRLQRVERTENGRTVTENVPVDAVDVHPIPLTSSRVDVALALEHRKKGLLWYDTYGVTFHGLYHARNPETVARTVVVDLAFPSDQVQFDQFVFRVNGQDAEQPSDKALGATARVTVAPGGDIAIEVGYASRGLDTWAYQFAPQGVAQVRDFRLAMRTDFDAIDYPAGSMSPTTATRAGAGWQLDWTFDSLLTGRRIGMDLPNLPNPGPLAARITYFAPVSLLFFITVVAILGVLRGRNLHPVHYAFLSAAFFAFHLLLAYLVDHVAMTTAFLIASAVSVFLVTSYLRVVTGPAFALLEAGLSQLVFLVLFSYAFFFEGYTGLTITIGAVLTLFVLMQATARVDWTVALGRPARTEGR